ncbi:MAG: hypothetical protein K0R14_744 [Burkholderiales bacterium]|jgi:uncharacterized membrane protein YtjA (UPF0391 family)|nr:hypothetical protein [Burkholderiales bacterium]
MLKWAVIFLVLTLITGSVGFSVAIVTLAIIAKVLFAIFLIGFVVSLIMHLMGIGTSKP